MPSWIEFRLATVGLLRLARFDADFQRFFDRSPSGALRSFGLAVPVLPYSILVIAQSGLLERVADVTYFTMTMSIGYVVLWLLPPAILTWVAPLIGRQSEVPGCIALYNWLTLLTVATRLPLVAVEMAGAPADIMAVPNNILLIVWLVWEAFLLTHTLRIALWQAALATIADYLLMRHLVMPIFLIVGGVS
ncbi:hypothetical protein [Dongia deserti]|uniref:hypothetical protein n=1 Tax=Dongia deserti TaxID=2268030 RepID=UPI000E64D811|nr:hypothetical protein [Dongia deserti]